MRTLPALLLTGLLATPGLAAEVYTVDARHTFPAFEINHLGFSTQRGRFDKTSGEIQLDRAKRSGSIRIEIDAASVSTGLAKLEEHLRAEDFFDVTKHPTITFTSDRLRFKGDRLIAAEGTFTLLGISRPLTLRVTGFNCGTHPMTKKEVCGADARATIRRSDYGMKAYLPALGDEVKLLINVEATKN